MAKTKGREKVRDGYFSDLPDDIQKKILSISRTIGEEIDSKLHDSHYEDLLKSKWAMSCLDEFKTKPTAVGDVGSIRVYKQGKKFKTMVQVTGHFQNHKYGWIEELLHEIVCHVFQDIRPSIRKKYDVALNNEGDRGEVNEGFDVFLGNDISKELWDKLEDRRTKTIKESGIFFMEEDEKTPNVDELYKKIVNEKRSMLIPIVKLVNESSDDIELSDDLFNYYENYSREMAYDQYFYEKSHGKLKYDFRFVIDVNTCHNIKIVYSLDNIEIKRAELGGKDFDNYLKDKNPKYQNLGTDKLYVQDKIKNIGNNNHQSRGQKVLAIIDMVTNEKLKTVEFIGAFNYEGIPWKLLNSKDVDKVKEYIKSKNIKTNTVSVGDIDNEFNYKSTYLPRKSSSRFNKYKNSNDPEDIKWMINDFEHERQRGSAKLNKNESAAMASYESSTNTPEYNVDMTEVQAKRTLRTLSQDIINKTKENDNYKINQYTANIYANIITKNLLPKWANGYKKLSITLDGNIDGFQFKVPTMSQDFISRFIDGREPMNAFLHRVPEIKIRINPSLFNTMGNADDGFTFFKAAVKYYDQKADRYSKQLMKDAMKLNRNIKNLIGTTKLSGLISYPLQLLFVFNDISMNDQQPFILSDDDVKAVNSFMSGIYTKYVSPEKEKTQIVNDVKTLVTKLMEACEYDDNMKELSYLPEAVSRWFTGGFDDAIQESKESFEREQVDMYEMANAEGQLKYIREKFGVKKLKRIPNDLVAYISIETEAIESPNDKMMIASYCLSKIEIVEWYIELLEVGSKKYIVPHSLPHLQNVRTQLLACYKKIMDTKVSSDRNRPIIDIKWPEGYEG